MNTLLYNTLWNIKQKALRPGFLKIISRIQNNQYLSAEELQTLQWEKIKALLEYAYEACPFYKKKYTRAGIHPDDIKDASSFNKIPVLTKEEVRLNLEEMVSTRVERIRLRKMFTGGSTGIPLMVYHDTNAAYTMSALNMRMLNWWGLNGVGEKTVHVWGLNPGNKHLMYDNQSRWNRFCSNYVYFNAFDMSPEKFRQWALFWRRFKPDIVIGYTSALYEFAQFLKEEPKYRIHPKAVWTTSEPLFYFQKKILEEIFEAKIYSQYGSCEVFHIAADCEKQKGLHINADSRFIQVVDDKGNPAPLGESGNILVTDLENYATPVIRYSNDDISSFKSTMCSCGCSLPLLNYISGRVCDIIKLKNGRKIHSEWFTHYFYSYINEIKTFQVHQTGLDKALVRIVPQKEINIAVIRKKIEEAFMSYTDNLMGFDIQFVKEIDKEKSGKFRFVQSDV